MTDASEQADLEEQVRHLKLLSSATRRLNSTLVLHELLDEIVGEVAEMFGCSRSAVLLLDPAKGELELVAVRGWTTEFHSKGFRFAVGRDGLIGRTAERRETSYVPDVRMDASYVVSEETTRSELDIPLVIRGELIGIFDVQHPEVDAFDESERSLLAALADHMASAIENARMFERERSAKLSLERDYAEARRIQRALTPQVPFEAGDFTVDGLCEPMRAVGGDWFDIFPVDGDRLAVALGDVSGKGMPAALLMAACRSSLRHSARVDSRPGAVLSHLNEMLRKDFPQGNFVTMVYATLETATGALTLAAAGHPAPLLCGTDGAVPIQIENGLPLGIARSSYPESGLVLQAGQTLVLYSDGVVEAENELGQELGDDGLSAVVEMQGLKPSHVIDRVAQFVSPSQMTDDATVVMIRRADHHSL